MASSKVAYGKAARKPVPIARVAATFSECKTLFFAMGESARQDIIMQLAQVEEMNVTQLSEKMALSRPAVSHHLKILRQAGLVDLRREGTENFYSLTIDDALGLLARFIDEVERCDS